MLRDLHNKWIIHRDVDRRSSDSTELQGSIERKVRQYA
jgi:hypothetical protein